MGCLYGITLISHLPLAYSDTGDTSDVVEVTVSDCVAICLEKQPDIRIYRFQSEIAEAQGEAEKEVFFPTLGLLSTFDTSKLHLDKNERDLSFSHFGDTDTSHMGFEGEAYLNGLFPWGMEYLLNFNASDSNLTVDAFTRILSHGADRFAMARTRSHSKEDAYAKNITLLLRQPLLKDRGAGVTLADYRIAKTNAQIEAENFRENLFMQMANVMVAYWNYVEAVEEKEVIVSALETASRFANENKIRIKIGTLAPTEIIEAEAGVTKCKGLLTAAKGKLNESQARLKSLMGLEMADALSQKNFVPKDLPHVRPVELNEELIISKALKVRPKVIISEHALTISQIEEHVSKNRLLPQLDAILSMKMGTSDGHITCIQRSSHYDDDKEDLAIGVAASISIGNHRAKNEYLKSRIQSDITREETRKAKNEIEWEVRNAIDYVETALALIDNTKKLRELNDNSLKNQEKLLGIGVATSFEVVQSQRNMYEARLDEVGALVSFEKALIWLQVAEGTLLENTGIAFE